MYKSKESKTVKINEHAGFEELKVEENLSWQYGARTIKADSSMVLALDKDQIEAYRLDGEEERKKAQTQQGRRKKRNKQR
jgi:hypothetical protein